jgi:hypothetical protein
VVRGYLEFYYKLTPEDLFKLKKSKQAGILENIQRHVSGESYGWKEVNGHYFPYSMLEPSSFKNNQRKSEDSTTRQSSSLIRRKNKLGGHFTLFLAELGNRSVCSETMEIAIRLSDMSFGDLPRVEKLEQGLSKSNTTHLHGILLSSIDWGDQLELKGYVIKFKKLGEDEEYQHLPIEEQVKKFVRYLKKPYDSKVLKRNRKLGLKSYALVQWFKLMYSQAIGTSKSFRTSRTVNLGYQVVKYPEEFMKHFFFDEVSRCEEKS